MYDRLAYILAVFISIAGLIAVVSVLSAVINNVLPWQQLWLLNNLPSILYVVILCTISWIWMPGPATAQYTAYSQPAAALPDGPDSIDGTADEEIGAAAAASGAAARTTVDSADVRIGVAVDESAGAHGDVIAGSAGRRGGDVEMTRIAPQSERFAIDDDEEEENDDDDDDDHDREGEGHLGSSRASGRKPKVLDGGS